jgi:hypothetical protein
VLGISAARMQSALDALTRDGCLRQAGVYGTSRCGLLEGAYYHDGYPFTGNVDLLALALAILPVLIGVFAGAPLLAREYEAGTVRFAWTQAAGRTRWVVAKLALLGVPLAAAGAAFGALLSWWLGVTAPMSDASRWQPSEFGSTAVEFAAWTLLAFAVGAFAGGLIRRTVPTMAATGAAVAALLAVTYKWLDPLLVSAGPLVRRVTVLNLLAYQPGSPPPVFVGLQGTATIVSTPPGSWTLRAWLTGPHGRPPSGAALQQFLALGPPAQDRWLTVHHATLWASYQPAGRFWPLQGAEAAACVLLALVLGAVTVWLVRRRAA